MKTLIYKLYAPRWEITLGTFYPTRKKAEAYRQTLKGIGFTTKFLIVPVETDQKLERRN